MSERASSTIAGHGVALSRRAFLGLCASAAGGMASDARGDAPAPPRMGTERGLHWMDHGLKGPDGERTRTLIFAPARERPAFVYGLDTRRYPALLLFDGAAGAEGLQAWRNQYGLIEACAELRRPPLALDPVRARFLRPRQLSRLNVELERQPFVGLVLICPAAPASDASEATIATYCDWLEHMLLPRAAVLGGVDETPCLGIAGYASGARLALEVFARKPHLFRTFGAAQPRFARARGLALVQRLTSGAAQSGFAGIHWQTSSADPYRSATYSLHRQLAQRGVASHLDDLLGPADAASWRAAGLLSVLAWHERMLQLIERPDPSRAPPESDPPARRGRRLPLRT